MILQMEFQAHEGEQIVRDSVHLIPIQQSLKYQFPETAPLQSNREKKTGVCLATAMPTIVFTT